MMSVIYLLLFRLSALKKIRENEKNFIINESIIFLVDNKNYY